MTTSKNFIDQTKIFIKAGDGGEGCVSFRREKFIPRGGPDGGNGGRGGDIVIVGTQHRSTLNHFRKKHHFKAERGRGGEGNQKTGADGESILIEVPLGTLIHDEATGEILGEILEHGQTFVVQYGGKGGLGNYQFRTSTNQAPTHAQPGIEVEGKWIILELKMLADVGIVGLPNAGKSTLLSSMTAAKSKIADYPFTTLFPYLGVLHHQDKKVTLADMPGLIEGAHQGAGLGIRFLRHIERTKVLLFLISAHPEDPALSFKDYETCQREIIYYNEDLKNHPFLVAINKVDLLEPAQIDETLNPFFARGIQPSVISAILGEGVPELMEKLHAAV